MRKILVVLGLVGLMAGFVVFVLPVKSEKITMIDLGTLGGDDPLLWSSANDINDLGQVVGWSQTLSGTSRAFLWENGEMKSLGAWRSNDLSSTAIDINNHGQIVGWSQTITGTFRAVLWENGVMTDLGTLGGNAFAIGINDLGQIVGFSELTTTQNRYTTHAFLWEKRCHD